MAFQSEAKHSCMFELWVLRKRCFDTSIALRLASLFLKNILDFYVSRKMETSGARH